MSILDSRIKLNYYKKSLGVYVDHNPTNEYKGQTIFLLQAKRHVSNMTMAEILNKYKSSAYNAIDLKDGSLIITKKMNKIIEIQNTEGIDSAIQYLLNSKRYHNLKKND